MMRLPLAFLGFALAGAVLAADAEPPALVGTWKVVEFKDDNTDQLGRLGVAKASADTKFAKLVFTETECWVVRADGKRDVQKGQSNCAFKSYRLTPGKTAHEIDLVGYAGNDAEVGYVGIVKIEGGKLYLCWNEEGTGCANGKRRPTTFESDGAMNLFAAERLSDKPEEKPKEANGASKK
jgi:uncharacterized protein (TIGR03067 family)